MSDAAGAFVLLATYATGIGASYLVQAALLAAA